MEMPKDGPIVRNSWGSARCAGPGGGVLWCLFAIANQWCVFLRIVYFS